MSRRTFGKLDHDGAARPASFDHLEPTAMHDEPAAERLECRVDALEIFDDRRAHVDVMHMSDRVTRHDLSFLFVADHNFPEWLRLLVVAKRRMHLVEAEDPIDHRLHPGARDGTIHRVEVRPAAGGDD